MRARHDRARGVGGRVGARRGARGRRGGARDRRAVGPGRGARADGGRRGRGGRVPQRPRLRARARGRGRDRARAAGGRRLLRRRDLRVAAGVVRGPGGRAVAARRADRARARDQVGAERRRRRPPSQRRAPVGDLRDDLVRRPRAGAPAQRRDLRRRRGRPLAVRLRHVGARGAAGRRRPAAGRRGAAPRLDRREHVPRARGRSGRRRGPRRGRDRGRGQRAPDGRAPLRARPARPVRARGSCCGERAGLPRRGGDRARPPPSRGGRRARGGAAWAGWTPTRTRRARSRRPTAASCC